MIETLIFHVYVNASEEAQQKSSDDDFDRHFLERGMWSRVITHDSSVRIYRYDTVRVSLKEDKTT